MHLRLRIVIDSISSYRQPQPGMEAIYFLMPTTHNVDRIIKDFSGPEPIYDGAHLFFMDCAFSRQCCADYEAPD